MHSRRAAILLLLLLTFAACGTDAPSDRAATPDSADEATDPGEAAGVLAEQGDYAGAISMLEDAGLDVEADRLARRGARTLLREARSALRKSRHKQAKRLASESRRLHKTTGARRVIRSANAAIAKAEAAARERRRLARVARDERTCSNAEKRTVRDLGTVPPGCAEYAAEAAADDAPGGDDDCDPNYAGACLKPDSPDYDCAGGSGDGPDYTGPVQVVGSDPHGLDRDGDGFACEAS